MLKNICHVISIVKTGTLMRCIKLEHVRDDVIAHRPRALSGSRVQLNLTFSLG